MNGKPVKTGLKSSKTVHPGSCLGENGTGFGYYAGLLRDVRIYGRALSDEEIEKLAGE